MTDKPKDPRSLPDLSPAEWEVMKTVWEHGPLAARDLYAKLPNEQGWTYATVKTMLRRIVKKGWIAYDQVGSSYLYRAAVRREKAVFSAVRDFSNRVLDGAFSPFVANFARQNDLTHEDIEELKRIIQEKRRNRS